MDILTKQQMTEEDIKLNFITPALFKQRLAEQDHNGDGGKAHRRQG